MHHPNGAKTASEVTVREAGKHDLVLQNSKIKKHFEADAEKQKYEDTSKAIDAKL